MYIYCHPQDHPPDSLNVDPNISVCLLPGVLIQHTWLVKEEAAKKKII